MSKEQDGGSAFPQPGEQYEDGDKVARSWSNPGMSLRDYFAGQALIGITFGMNSADRRRYRERLADGHEACVAYAVADAMIAERDK